jgi:hypothetical protein
MYLLFEHPMAKLSTNQDSFWSLEIQMIVVQEILIFLFLHRSLFLYDLELLYQQLRL